jgi:hypothetical protein
MDVDLKTNSHFETHRKCGIESQILNGSTVDTTRRLQSGILIDYCKECCQLFSSFLKGMISFPYIESGLVSISNKHCFVEVLDADARCITVKE